MNKDNSSRLIKLVIPALLCQVLWGSAIPSIKTAYKLFSIVSGESMSQLLMAGVRFLLAGVLAVIFGSIPEKKLLVPKKSSIPMIAALAMVQTVAQYFFFFIGVANSDGMKSAVIQGCSTFIAILFAVFVFRQEKMTLRKLIGCIVGFAGIVVINMNGGKLGRLNLTGDGFVIISTSAGAVAASMIKKFSQKENPVTLNGYQFMLGGLVLIAIGLVGGGKLRPVSGMAWVLMLYMGFLSAAAYSIWSILLKNYPVSRVTVYSFMNPVFGVIFCALLLKEENAFTLPQLIISLALVCAGILIVNLKGKNNTDAVLTESRK